MATTSRAAPYRTHLAYFLDRRSHKAPAIRVVEPALDDVRLQRGNLYILIELMGESPVKGPALRHLQSIIQQTYYTAGGSLSSVLEQTIEAAHVALQRLNQRGPDTDLRAGVTCAALVQRHLMIAAAGPALALLATENRLDQFPPDPSHYIGPIGGESPPAIHFYRHQVQDGDVLFLGESDWILLTDVRTLGGAIASTSIANRHDMVDYLHKQSDNADVLGLMIVFEAPRHPLAGPSMSQGSHLPTAVGAAPPVHNVPPTLEYGGAEAVPAEVPTVWEDPSSASSAVRRLRQSTLSHSAEIQRSIQGEILPPSPVPRGRRVRPVRRPARARIRRFWEALRHGIGALVRGILPERSSGASTTGEWIGAPALPAQPESKPRRSAPFAPPERTRGNRARLFILLAILIPLLAFAAVGAVYLQEGAAKQVEGQKFVDLAEGELLKAQQALGVNDKHTARSLLGEAQRYLNEAVTLLGITDRIRELSRMIERERQDLYQVRGLYSLDFPLVQFPADADPHRVIVFDQDIYVLDTGRQVVEHFRSNPERTLVEERSGVVLQEGDVVEGVTVGRLVDIAWQPRIPGFADKASLLVLDRNNNLFRYNRFDEATYLRLAASDSLGSIGAVETYSGRLYLADEQQDQILRYSPAGSGYDEPPDLWFRPQVQADLSGLVDMAIDSDIWLLLDTGTLLRYQQGQQLPFSLEPIAGLTGRLVDMAIVGQADGSIYLADGAQDRIFVFDKQGNYVEQFVAVENDALRGLRSIYLDEVTGTLFILTQTSLYAHPLPR